MMLDLTQVSPKMKDIATLIYAIGLPGVILLFFLGQSAGIIPSIDRQNNILLAKNQQYMASLIASQTHHMNASLVQTHVMRELCLNEAQDDSQARARCMSNP